MANNSLDADAYCDAVFAYCWTEIIDKTGDRIADLLSRNDQCNVKYTSKKDALYKKFSGYYKEYTKVFSGKIPDHHKVSSMLFCSIITACPMEFRQSGAPSVRREGRVCNEIYAIHCAIAILKGVMESNMENGFIKRSDSYIEAFRKSRMFFPNIANEGHKGKKTSYLMCLVSDIYTFRINSPEEISTRLIPILFHVFFFLEKFHLKNFHNNQTSAHIH